MLDASKPLAVTTAVRALYIAQAIGFIAVALFIATGAGMSLPLPLSVFFIPSLLCSFGLPALLVHGISTRKNWARLIYLVSFVLGMLTAIPTMLLEASRLSAWIAVDAVVIVIQIYPLYLLFTRSSNEWFRSARAA